MYSKDDILGFETDTVWGIGCHPLNKKAVETIYEIKGRDKSKPLILMSNDIKYLSPFIKDVPLYAKKYMEKFFPGALTLIFNKTSLCPDYLTSGFDTVGIRMPNHKGFFEIIENVEDKVLATTSLNISNEPPVKNYTEANEKFGSKIKVIPYENKEGLLNQASTVVLCTGENPVILRQGTVFID